jgi:hypothetical protein
VASPQYAIDQAAAAAAAAAAYAAQQAYYAANPTVYARCVGI